MMASYLDGISKAILVDKNGNELNLDFNSFAEIEEPIIENPLVGMNDYYKKYVFQIESINQTKDKLNKLIAHWKEFAFIPNLKRLQTFYPNTEFYTAQKIKLFKKLKYFPQKETFKYCQSQIEGRKKCKTQCSHCKQYYKTLENANIH